MLVCLCAHTLYNIYIYTSFVKGYENFLFYDHVFLYQGQIDRKVIEGHACKHFRSHRLIFWGIFCWYLTQPMQRQTITTLTIKIIKTENTEDFW